LSYKAIKVPLKAKIVQILFSQIHQNYAKYTFETFTVDWITIAYQIESMTWIRMFCICIILVKNLRKSEHIIIFFLNPRNTFRQLLQKHCLTIYEVQVGSWNSVGGCLASRKKCYFCYDHGRLGQGYCTDPYTAYSGYIEIQGTKHILSIYPKFNMSEISNIFSFLRSSHSCYLYQVQTVKNAVPLLFLPV
jgi:hypothetical protein